MIKNTSLSSSIDHSVINLKGGNIFVSVDGKKIVKRYYCWEYLHKSFENLSVYFGVVYVYYVHARYLGIG